MAYTKTQFVPDEYAVQKVRLLRLNDGESPALNQLAAYYLPVQEKDYHFDLWFVVVAGQVVSFDQTSLNSGAIDNKLWMVPANGGAEQIVTYTANDVSLTADIDELETGAYTAVTAAGAATKRLAANYPAGITEKNWYSMAYHKAHDNIKPANRCTYVTRGLFEIPLLYGSGATLGAHTTQDQSTITRSCLLKSGPLGWPVEWDSAHDSVDQLIGRCETLTTIAAVDALDKVQTVKGLNLPGTGTSGRQLHENYYLYGTTTLVTTKMAYHLRLA